jgi:hypothetical protein
LINKDPFGKGWIAEIKPSHLHEDLKKWSGDTTVLDKKEKSGSEANTQTKINSEKSSPGSQEKQTDKSHKVKIDVSKFFLSAIISRSSFLASLPVRLGLIIKSIFHGVSPKGAN